MLGSYDALVERIEKFAASVCARYYAQMDCRPGCADCCQDSLTVVAVEAMALGRALGIPAERILGVIGRPPSGATGRCVFLNRDQLCAVYTARPVICRTHGLPMLYPGKRELNVCEKNFGASAPQRSDILDMSNLETALFASNLEYCRKKGIDPLARVALDRLASLV